MNTDFYSKNFYQSPHQQVVCVTGGAKRIGAGIVKQFHQAGFSVIIHYQHSQTDAENLANQCNQIRQNSAKCVYADLANVDFDNFAQQILACFGRLDILVHNASRFYPTTFGDISITDWDNLIISNAQAPLFLTQSLLIELNNRQGSVISILDIHADNRPFLGYTVYNMAKSAHRMLVQSLALELAPHIRVNGVAPGVNILPESNSEQALSDTQLTKICESVPLQRIGTPEDIAQAVLFLASAPYITGQILAVDGGRSLTLAGQV